MNFLTRPQRCIVGVAGHLNYEPILEEPTLFDDGSDDGTSNFHEDVRCSSELRERSALTILVRVCIRDRRCTSIEFRPERLYTRRFARSQCFNYSGAEYQSIYVYVRIHW